MVMIGDTSRDVNAAKNIGCHSILIIDQAIHHRILDRNIQSQMLWKY